MSNNCPYCGSLRNVCVNPVSFKYVCLACEKFFNKGEQPRQTVFERITQSEETLAEKLVYFKERIFPDDIWGSTLFFRQSFYSKEEAIAATVARLKEVAE